MSRWFSCTLLLVLVGCSSQREFVPLFNGEDLSGWRIVNTDSSTWTVRDGTIVCSGRPIGELCTTRHYENYVLELEWRHLHEGGNAGLFLHSDPLPAIGQPFTRAIECQVMDGNHGDVFAIHGATMVPDRPHPRGWMRSLPVEERANPTGEWNHYRVESRDGTVTLAVNGKVVSGGSEISPRKGYICLESEGSEVHFRNIRIHELPSSNPPPEQTADVFEGHRTLYTGVDLSGWRTSDPDAWEVDDWVLRSRAVDAETGSGSERGMSSSAEDGAASSAAAGPGLDSAAPHLWTEASFGDVELIADFRVECEGDAPAPLPRSALLLRGREDLRVAIGCAAALSGERGADRQPTTEPGPLAMATEEGASERGWRRLVVRLADNQAIIHLDGSEIGRAALPAGAPGEGAIGLAHYGAQVEFANLFVKPLTP